MRTWSRTSVARLLPLLDTRSCCSYRFRGISKEFSIRLSSLITLVGRVVGVDLMLIHLFR